MKTVNLNEILSKQKPNFEYPMYYHEADILNAMREACEQTVDLCAENAIAEQINNRIQINKQSILNTKTQIV